MMEKIIGSFILLSLCMVIISCSEEEKTDGEKQIQYEGLFPEAGDIEGLTGESPVKVFKKDSLKEYLKGETDLFSDYGTEDIQLVEYKTTGNTAITAAVFDMGSSWNAFGVFSMKRMPEYGFLSIGDEAMMGENSLEFIKGRYYVELKAGRNEGTVGETLKLLASKISERIDESGKRPGIVFLLPEKGKMVNTEKYFVSVLGLNRIYYHTMEDVLNIRDGVKGAAAKYYFDDGSFMGFIIEYPKREPADSAFERYYDYMFSKSDSLREKGVLIQSYVKGQETIFTKKGRYIFGAWVVVNDDRAMEFIDELKRRDI